MTFKRTNETFSKSVLDRKLFQFFALQGSRLRRNKKLEFALRLANIPIDLCMQKANAIIAHIKMPEWVRQQTAHTRIKKHFAGTNV